MSDPRLDIARAAFRTVSISVRDDVLDDALLAVLRAIDVLQTNPVSPGETPPTVREPCERENG